jgi:predicted metal-binding membrane protein
MMNIAAMAVVTALIFAEKSFHNGERIAQAAAVLLIFYGAFVIAVPSSLPISL